jgi:hypothetical protein
VGESVKFDVHQSFRHNSTQNNEAHPKNHYLPKIRFQTNHLAQSEALVPEMFLCAPPGSGTIDYYCKESKCKYSGDKSFIVQGCHKEPRTRFKSFIEEF